MTCETATELLPWLLNGTLAAGERDEVWHHLKTCESCRGALAETRQAWSLFAQHLPSQNLVALAWGETPSAAVEEHLASCARCTAELELVRMSRRLEEEENIALFPAARPRPAVAPWSRRVAVAAGLTAVVAASGWIYEARQASDLSRQLAQAGAPASAPAAPQRPAGETSALREEAARLQAEVAQLLGLQQQNEQQVAAAQAQVAQMEKERQLLTRPHASAMVDLGSGDVVREGGAAEEKTLRRDRFNTLLLPARDGEAGRAEIRDGAGKVVWQASQLPVTQGYHSLVLPPGSLPPGRYTLRLAGREERWDFQVVP